MKSHRTATQREGEEFYKGYREELSNSNTRDTSASVNPDEQASNTIIYSLKLSPTRIYSDDIYASLSNVNVRTNMKQAANAYTLPCSHDDVCYNNRVTIHNTEHMMRALNNRSLLHSLKLTVIIELTNTNMHSCWYCVCIARDRSTTYST